MEDVATHMAQRDRFSFHAMTGFSSGGKSPKCESFGIAGQGGGGGLFVNGGGTLIVRMIGTRLGDFDS